MNNSNFKLIFTIIFIALGVLGLLVFSGYLDVGFSKNNTTVTGTVKLWGTLDQNVVRSLLDNFNTRNQTFTVEYEAFSPNTFDKELLEALARGDGPDMFLITDDLVSRYADKIYKIPYASYPITSFKDTFAPASEIFLASDGVLAMPLTIDPMIMYYNRSFLNTNSIVYPPTTWEEVASLAPKLMSKGETNQIVKTGMALGQFSNILHAKDILATLILQTGNPIIANKNGYQAVYLAESQSYYNLDNLLTFYTSFSDPLKQVYSWNRSLPLDRDFFSSENSAFYLGYASELPTLLRKNPNQDLQITFVPQYKNSKFKVTKGRVLGVAISSATKKLNTAYTAATMMTASDFASKFVEEFSSTPARRDLLVEKINDPYMPIIYQSALFAKSWPDPSPEDTTDIFRSMVDDVNSGAVKPREAVDTAGGRLNLLLRK